MTELRTVAALYVDRLGPYPGMPGVDAWDEARDARLYHGPHPVVAHPPCGPWANLKHLHTRPDERELGVMAVFQVLQWGGVLEQPAGSLLWERMDLPTPIASDRPEFGRRGFTIEVEQVEWGHVARKRTWLYLVGVPREAITAPPFPGREPTHWVSGGRRHARKGSGGFAPPGIKICSAQQRRRTPPAFAEWLVSLARASRKDAP